MKIKKIKKPIISALEQRILFDGAAVATVVDVLDNSSFSSNDTTTTSNDVTSNNAENSVHEAQAVQGFERPRKEVAFVDATVTDYQTLVDGVGEGVETYLVTSMDGIKAILANETNIDAIHILSHGTTGEITVGNDVLNDTTLADNALLLETMKNSLSENGDILLYGCNVASDGSGQEFINTFAQITQADVAASNDVTGNSNLNGDWDLEVESGVIDTEEIVVDNYNFVLGTESSIIMNNGYIKTAISTDGTLGIGSTGNPGIQYDSNGGGDDYLDTADYLTPGTPQELFSIEYDGNLLTNNNAAYTSPAIPTIISGDTNQVVAVSTTSDGKLEITQVYSLPEGAKVLTITVSIKNISSSTVTGVKFLRSTDPDVDSNGLAGSTSSTNNFRGSTVNSAENFVYSVGPVSGRVIGLFSSDATTHNTSVSSWTTDPDIALAGGNVGNGDNTIDLGFNLGNLNAGGTGSFSFLYVFADTVPEAESHIATAESNTAPTQTTIPTQNLVEDFTTYTIDLKDYFEDAETSDADLNYFYSGNTNIAVSITNGVATISSLTSNWVGSENITFSIKDPYGKSVSQSVAFDITAVNDAPTGTNKTITTNEDTSKLLVSSDFGFSDVDGDTLSSVKITSLATDGVLEYYNGSIWQNVTSDQSITKANIDSGHLRFNPSLNENGTNYASFGFKVNDGTVDSVNTYTITYNVTATNDAPTIESTTAIDYNSTTALSTIISPSLVLNDIDSATLSSATISISNGFVAGDILTFTNNNATTYGNITTSYNSSTGVLTLASSGNTATKAQFQSALQNVTYSSSASNLSDGSRTISWIVNDGAANSLTDTSTINVFSDFDNDGVKDSNDIDDDNDGILDINESTENFQWAGGYSISGNTATGNIDGIGFTYTLTNLDQTALNIATTSSMFSHTTFPSEYNVPNSDPTIRNDLASINTLDFSSTILNPVLSFSSIGSPSIPVQIQFYNDIEILFSTATGGGSISYDPITRILTGAEGFAVIKIAGEFNQIKFDYLSDETYVNFAFGADVRQDVDTDGDSKVDRLDTDSDNDGVLDNVEAQVAGGFGVVADPTTLSGYIAPSGLDIDIDGLDDIYDLNTSSTQSTVSAGLIPIDSNSNGTADYLVDEAPVLTVGTLASHDGSNTSSEIIAPALTLVDVENHNISQAKIQINNFVSGDTLSFTNDGSTMGSITSSYNSLTGILTLSGTATVSQYEAALKSVEFNKVNSDTTDRSFSFTVGSAIPYSGNGHYYEVAYFTSGKTWDQAKAFAETQTLYGMQGYLATITSADENAFILSKLPSDAWIGGSDADVEGTWKWVTGPETGQTMTYTNWNSGEPNNSGSNEDAAEFYATGSNPGKWNDLASSSGTLQYAIIEYGGMPTDSTVPVISATATMIVNDAPTIESTTTVTYTEHDTPIIISPSVTIGDTDSTTIESATISISSNFVSGDTLSFTNDDSSKYGNITASYDSSTGVLTLSSSGSTATMQQWKDALENTKFSISSSTDVVNSATKTISWKVNDGSLDSLVDTSSVDVQGFGKMPYIYGTDKATVNEDSSVSLSGFSVGDDDTTILTVSIVSQHGNLSLGTTTGITGYSSATKTLEITGTSTDLQNALNSMVYTPDANYNGLDELVIKTSDDSGKSWSDYYVSRTGLFYNPTNQHYYEFVSTPLSWDAAKTAAESRTYLGLGGYLATVTSSAENALIASKLGGNGWMGASDATQTWTRADGTTFTTSEGNWTWISGPEAGTKFWQDETNELGITESVQGYTVNGMYANFASGEPNNYGGDEDVAHFYSNNGTWNDYPNSMNLGYVVEYGGLSTGISSKPEAAKLEITVVSVNDLPVNNNVPSSVTTNEDTSIVFSSANSNAITITDIDAITVTTTLSIGSGKGTLTVVEGNGATITNNGTTTVQITGTVEQVNSALDGLVYNPTSNANGNAYTTLTISTNDGFATDLDFVTINVTAVDDLPVANSMAATVGVGSAQLFSYFQPNFFDVDNDAPVAIKLNSAPDKGQFEHWNGTSWEIVSNITPSTPLIVAMSEMNDYRFNALSESNTSTTVQWQVKTAGDTSDTGWSNTATGAITILSYANNTTPSVSITYPTGTTTGTPSTQTVEAPDSSNPTSSVETITSNNVIPINEDTQTATITLTYSDSVTPAQFMQGIMTLSNTRLIDFSDPSTFVMTQSVVNNVGTITLILKPKADMYGDTLITLGAFDGQKTSQETFTLRVNSVNEQAIVDNFTKTIDEDTLFSFATINPADIYHDANDVNNNANVSAVDYNAQMAIIKDAMMNPSNTDKQTAKAAAITALVDANYFPKSFIIDTLPTNGDLYLGSTKITTTSYTVAIADLETLSYQPDANYYGMDSFTWYALDKEGLATTIKTATFTVNPINDAPVITSPSTIQIVDTTGASINGTITNTLVANDVDNTSLTYKIDSGAGVFVETMVGTYGTLVINSTSGDYEFIPNQSAITALDSDTTETFTLNVSDGVLFDTTTLTINITAAPEATSIYREQADATLILTDTSINTQESYGGGSIEFDLNDPLLTETLDIQKVLNADITAGVVSIVGNSVYLGNGTTASVIGQIDSVYNGENGQKLKINFSVDFANGKFDSLNNSVGLLSSTVNEVITIDGWNIVNGRVNLGIDTIAGLATPQDTTNPTKVITATDKDGDILRRGTFYTYVNDDDGSLGDDNSIKLNSSLTSTNGYAIVRGPYIYSDAAVSLKVGDSVQFDWKAQGGADAYDVFGYIVDVNNPSNYQIILNQTGANARATTAWSTVSTTIATDGEYKFVFVSGSWDATGGKALGAQLYIDDVKVTQSNPTSGLGSDILEKIAQKVTYQNSSDLSASNGIINKTITVTASSGDVTPIVHSSIKALNIQEVNDSITLVSSVSNIYYTDTDGVDNFSNTTGKLSATDVDSATVFTYGIDGSTSNGDGTITKSGSYGTLTLDSATGEYTFTPNSDVINALSSNVSETFTFNVNDGSGSSDSKVLTINIESVNDAPLLGGVTSTPTFTENGTAVLVDPTITITDLEGTSYDSGYVAFKTSQNGQVEDTLSILNIGGISVSGNNVNYGGVTIGTIDSIYDGQNGKELRINLNSNAYSSQVQALARAIALSNPTDDLSSSARTIEIKINDGGNGGDTTARYSIKEATVNIQTINDLAQINLGNESLVVEKSIFANPNGDLDLGSMISFADLDGDTLTVVIETTNYGLINVNDSVSNGLNSSQISGNNSRVVTLTGTIEQINNTLAASNGASYTAGGGNDYITPGADYLKVTATDELGGVSTSQKLVMVLPAIPNAYSDNIIAKEDNNAIVDISSLTSDINDNAGTYIFGTGSADITDVNGNITSSGNITAFEPDKIVFSSYDIDGDNNPFTQSPIGYQLANGKLILDNDQILGTDFAKFTFIPNENWSGVETFVYQYTSGDAKVSNIAQVSIYVIAVNDAPIVTVSNSETINEDSSIVFKNTNAITLADIDIVNPNQMLDLTLSVENGKLELAQNSGLTILEGNDNSSKIKVQGNLSNLQNAIDGLKYTSNQDYNGTDALIVKLNDNGNTGESGILESEQTINITINAVNDAPVFTSQVDDVVEGVIINGVLPASDVDSSSLAFSIEGNLPTGFVLNRDGSYTFDSSSYNHLGAGETQTIIVPVSVTDIEGLKTTANFSITIIGSNDSPDIQIVDVNANIVEGSVLSDTGSITFTDLDLTDRAVATEATKSVTAVSQDGVTPLVLTSIQQQDIEAAFTINNVNTNTNDGIVTWDYTIAEGKLDFLGEGEIVTAVFTITVTDDEGAADTQDVIVRIIGSNDSPIVSFENVNDSTPFGEAFTKNIASLFSDKDLTNVFTYEAINLPRGLVIDSKTGVISGAAIESGIFEIILIGKDSGNPSLSVSRTFSLLVIAPAQAETITVPTSSDTANTNSNTNNDITLNNFNDN